MITLFLPIAALAQASTAPRSVAAPIITGTNISFTVTRSADPGSIPYEYADSHIVFKAEVGGQSVWMMLDTGSTHSIIDETLAKQLGMSIKSTPGNYYTVGGHLMPSRYVQDVALVVPHSFAGRIPMGVFDLSKVDPAGHSIKAVLGMDLLAQLATVLDKRSGELRFLIGTGPVKITGGPASFKPIPVKIEGDRLRTSAMVGSQALSLTIDTGEHAGLALSPAAWARVKPNDAQIFQRKIKGASGVGDTIAASRLPEVTIGTAVSSDVEVVVLPQQSKDGDGTIGMGVLARYSLVLDPRHGQMLLIATATPTASLPAPVSVSGH